MDLQVLKMKTESMHKFIGREDGCPIDDCDRELKREGDFINQ